MGKLTRPSLTFLLGMANVRLGVWLPSPRAICQYRERLNELPEPAPSRVSTFVQARLKGIPMTKRPPPRPIPFKARPHYLLKELLGWSSYRDRFVYVTDGGHYENLGLVELLRKGCTDIYCFDATGDFMETFRTLGQAIALARSELGVEICIEPEPMAPKEKDGPAQKDHVVGRFRFRSDPLDEWQGRLVFAKAAVTESASWDIQAYWRADKRFPCHPTYEQLYTDERFEAYRALGHYTASQAIKTMRAERDRDRRSNGKGPKECPPTSSPGRARVRFGKLRHRSRP
jgi:hypothetical protein